MEKIKIFIVDDNLAARNMLKHMIETQGDMEIVGEGGSGKASVPMIEQTAPDVVLLEVEAGGGLAIEEVMAQIKRVNPAIHVIFCAAPNDDGLIAPLMGSGAEDFIRKPYNSVSLLRTIRHVVNK